MAPNTAISGKPAATIPPNTSNANPATDTYNSYDPNKSVHPNGGQYGYGQDMNQPPNAYPPYGYQQYPQQHQQNYYGQGDAYGQQYAGGYYPQQPYGGEYSHYNQPNSQSQNPGSLPPPQQGYPQNPAYNPQGYWGPDNNYYNNTNSDYYQNPNQSHTGYPNNPSNPDPYPNSYDPYAQQTQPYHGFNSQTRAYDRNVPNGEQGFDSTAPNNAPYPPPVMPGAANAPVFPMQPSSETAAVSSYDSTMYPGYQNAQTTPAVPDKPAIVTSAGGMPPENPPTWPIPCDDLNSKNMNHFNNIDIKHESKTDSDGEFKIADLDTMKVIKDVKCEIKSEFKQESAFIKEEIKEDVTTEIVPKVDEPAKVNTDSVDVIPKIDDSVKNVEEKEKPKKSKDKTKSKDKKDKKGGKSSKDKSKNGEESGKDSDEERKDKEDSDSKKMEVKEEVPYEWANDVLKTYIPGIIENSAKMEIFFCILIESIRLGDRLLLFSQSLFTLNLIEDFLQRNYIYGTDVPWAKNKSYYRKQT